MALPLVERLARRLPDIARVVARFPVAAAALLTLTLYLVLDLHLTADWSIDTRFVRIPTALGGAALAAIAATLFAEARGWPAPSTHALSLAAAALACLTVWLGNALELSPGLMVAALALSIGLAPYAGRGPADGPFWQLGHTVAVALVVSLVATSLFAGGLSLILETLRVLLGIELPPRALEKVWTIAACLVGPLLALSLVPRNLDEPPRLGPEGQPLDFTGRAIAALVRFVAVPLLLVYALILHAAALKAALDGALPHNRVGWMVLSFGTATAVTALAAWPTRASSGRLVALFWRLWPWLLVVPLVVLALALSLRVGAYGWTGPRYLAALAGLWLALLVVGHSLLPALGRARNLRPIQSALALLVATAAVGPWGYTGLPVRSQARDFGALLEQAGAIENGRIALAEGARPRLDAAQKERLGGIVAWLADRGRLRALRPYFQGVASDPFRDHEAGGGRARDLPVADRIRERLDLARAPAATRWVGYQAASAAPIEVGSARMLIGPFSLTSGSARPAGEPARSTHGLDVVLEAEALVVTEPASGRRARFDLGALLADPDVGAPYRADQPRPPRVLAAASGALPARLVVIGLSGRDDGASLSVTSLVCWLLLAP